MPPLPVTTVLLSVTTVLLAFACSYLSPTASQRPSATILLPFQSADILVTGTLGLAYDITGATMDAITAMARNNGVTVIIDINWRPVFWPSVEKRTDEIRKRICDYIDTANIIKISDADLEYLYGINPEEALRRPQMVAEKLPNASAVLVTGGGLGAAYCFKKEGGDIAGFVPSFLVDVVDTTGAGDAFTAGFIYRLLEVGVGVWG